MVPIWAEALKKKGTRFFVTTSSDNSFLSNLTTTENSMLYGTNVHRAVFSLQALLVLTF